MSKLKADNISPYIGLAQRANAVLYGEDIILEKLKYAKVVIVDATASDKYIARLQSKITNCPFFVADGLKEALHKDNVNAVAIINESLANAIIQLLR